MKKMFILLAILVLTAVGTFAGEVNTDAMLQYNQGIDYYKGGQYDSAITSFREAIRLDPNYIDAYYNLGSVLEYLQQYEAALAVFKQIIVRQPDDYDSAYKAAWLSFKMGDAQRARTYLTLIPPTSARAQDAKALAAQLPATPLPTMKNPATIPKKVSVNQTSGIYQNILAPTGIASDKSGNIYVAEFNSNTIVKLTPEGKKVVFVKDAKISGPIGLAYDKAKNLYIANYNKDNVLKISPLGAVSVLISNVKKPYCIYIDNNILFVSCQGSNSVLRYKLP